MSKVKKKYIRLGTGTDDLNARDIPANFTPITYNPTEVSSEGIDKISAHLKGIDIQLAAAGPGHLDLFEVASIATPASGYDRLQTKTDGFLYLRDDTGQEIQLTGALGTVVKSITIAAAATGYFDTGKKGSPIITLRFWDNSLSDFDYLSTASFLISTNSAGDSIYYDLTSKEFDSQDYVEILATYAETGSVSNEFDSDWVLVSSINNTPSSGYHLLSLPSGFTETPPGYSFTLKDVSGNVYPGNMVDSLSFSSTGNSQYITVNTLTDSLPSTTYFRVTASTSVRPTALSQDTTFYGSVALKTASYVITDVDDLMTVVITNSSSMRTITLPNVFSNKGRILVVKNKSSQGGVVTVDGNGANIDGMGTRDLTAQYDSIMVQSDGTDWNII
jgi:hypothetical protein